ncbi:unnamed protein product [Leptidea sinapis]|uniref:Uncharacterized protein n=1 Tax=Leptidea sinapis TaxID=189913 RepID=A0A5E4Q038_9NEOP|nr:unnamed protein product [Leptidea sinapis]
MGPQICLPGDKGAPESAATPVASRPSRGVSLDKPISEAALPPEPCPITTSRERSPPKNSM